MVQVRAIDQNGGPAEAVAVRPEVFGVPIRIPLLHQAVTRELAGRRVGTHASRGRSEVSGGGKKPWRQKGTGRARQGSIRATQWKGGGRPFGPKPRDYGQALPRQARRAALRSALAAKVGADALTVVQRLELAEPKTKALVKQLAALGVAGSPTLLIVEELSPAVSRAARNVPWLTVETPSHTSTYQVLRHHAVLVERAALVALEAALST